MKPNSQPDTFMPSWMLVLITIILGMGLGTISHLTGEISSQAEIIRQYENVIRTPKVNDGEYESKELSATCTAWMFNANMKEVRERICRRPK